jgi:hypothetical protein
VVAQRVDCNATHLLIFTRGIVPGNHALDFVAQSFIQRLLASNGSPAGSFGSTPGFENFTSTLRLEAP